MGSCHKVTTVNFRFHESRNKTFTSVKFTKVTEKKSDHKALKFSYELNFRHSRFISYLFTIHSQGLLHFTPHGIHFNHHLRNRFLPNHDSHSTKKPDRSENTLAPPSINIISCVIRSPADYMAEWKFGSLDTKTRVTPKARSVHGRAINKLLCESTASFP